jgi:hypothetical protein
VKTLLDLDRVVAPETVAVIAQTAKAERSGFPFRATCVALTSRRTAPPAQP